jgi:WD40 repeat protein
MLQHAVFSPDAGLLIACLGRTFRVFSVETGKPLGDFPTDSLQQPDLAISADGKLLLANQHADFNGSNPDGSLKPLDPKTHVLRLWDLPNRKEIWRQDLPGGLSGPVGMSADGKRFAVSVHSDSREIRVCDLVKHEVLQTIKDEGYPRSLSFSPDGRLLVAGMEDGTAVTWDISQP